ncbi:MAG: hypothetical protein IJJ82_00015 [Clostridia bacterium]|nr:hypothetical protein [Clostridia bacterium]
MKSKAIIILAIVAILAILFCTPKVYAENKVLDSKIESQLVEIKEHEAQTIEDYQARYGSEAYGTVAYILELVRAWSIPLCFLGIAIGAVHKSILGIRKLDTLEKGRGMVVMFITILLICQILPLAFALVVKFGRG